MSITWTITALNCYSTDNGNADVVFNVHWSCVGTDGEYNSSVINTCQVEFTGGTFIPYEQLTQEQVLEWIWSNGVDKDATEEAIAQMLEQQKTPPVVTPPLPWSQA